MVVDTLWDYNINNECKYTIKKDCVYCEGKVINYTYVKEYERLMCLCDRLYNSSCYGISAYYGDKMSIIVNKGYTESHIIISYSDYHECEVKLPLINQGNKIVVYRIKVSKGGTKKIYMGAINEENI